MVRQQPLLISMVCAAAAPLTAVQAFTTTTAFVGPVRCTTRNNHRQLFAEQQGGDAEEVAAAEEIPVEHEHSEGVENPYLPSEGDSDILNSPAFLARKVEVLKADIEKAEEQIVQAKTVLDAGKAEWEQKFKELEREAKNIQDRMAALSRDGEGMATVEVTRTILEVLENYDRAFQTIKPTTDEEKEIDAAYRKTYDDILKIMNDLGVTQIESVGLEFDYEVHNAIMTRPSEYEEGIVCEELQKGYKMGDQLIRAAAVVVSN